MRLNPKPWQSVKRYDGPGGVDDRHYNKVLKVYITTPHIHDPCATYRWHKISGNMGNSNRIRYSMINDNLIWLISWFHQQCDGDWEHGNGIRMGTLDNPGWYLTVSLKDTKIETKQFKDIIIERSENDWVHCFVREGKFEGPCGPFNLPEVLKIFHDWVENDQD